MSDMGERGREEAQALQEAERDRSVARIRQAMCQKGDKFCVDCGCEIGLARRAAMPSAIRCITCQTAHEARK